MNHHLWVIIIERTVIFSLITRWGLVWIGFWFFISVMTVSWVNRGQKGSPNWADVRHHAVGMSARPWSPDSKWHFPLATFSSLFGLGLGFFSELLFVSRLSLVVIVGWFFSTRFVTFRTSGCVSRDWVWGNSISPFIAPVVEPFFFEVDFSTEFRLVEAGFGLSFMASMRLRRCGTHVAVTPVVTKMPVGKFLQHFMVPRVDFKDLPRRIVPLENLPGCGVFSVDVLSVWFGVFWTFGGAIGFWSFDRDGSGDIEVPVRKTSAKITVSLEFVIMRLQTYFWGFQLIEFLFWVGKRWSWWIAKRWKVMSHQFKSWYHGYINNWARGLNKNMTHIIWVILDSIELYLFWIGCWSAIGFSSIIFFPFWNKLSKSI